MHEAVEAKMNPEIREMLLSHSIGLASAYYRPSEQELLGEYMKAVDNGYFCISEEKKWKRKAEKLEVEKMEFERLRFFYPIPLGILINYSHCSVRFNTLVDVILYSAVS